MMAFFAGGDLPGFKYIFGFIFLVYATVVGFGVSYLIYFFINKRRKK